MIPVPKERRKGNGKAIKVTGASENNLKMSVLNFRWVNLLLSQAFQVQESTLVNQILKSAGPKIKS